MAMYNDNNWMRNAYYQQKRRQRTHEEVFEAFERFIHDNAGAFGGFDRGVNTKTSPKAASISLSDMSRQEIEHELDIIKGVVETPRGYAVSKERARELVKELRKR